MHPEEAKLKYEGLISLYRQWHHSSPRDRLIENLEFLRGSIRSLTLTTNYNWDEVRGVLDAIDVECYGELLFF